MARRFPAGLAVAIVVVATGCSSGRKIVAVSGTVTLDGNPVGNVIVSFQPIAAVGEENPGRGSSAVTDDKGRYTLIYDGEKPGALTGKHRIRIFPQIGAEKGQDDGVEVPKNARVPRHKIFIPSEWNETSTQEFEVPEKGTDSADFKIETKPSLR